MADAHRRVADAERCCAEVLEQQSAEGHKLKEEWQKITAARQKLKEQAASSRNLCLVCFQLADWSTIPCGHACYCNTHGPVAKALEDRCPVCKGDITDGLKIFLGGFHP
ncbi:unnamed protein product [Symbiodinium natans]|uniref:RING-type domain-containing protein n=1 Tax=Symbiodinium natans TaxID=878477 RepID=A0A812SRE3_9DINO|nr:unnamed protein product [Symbiodinium natans]